MHRRLVTIALVLLLAPARHVSAQSAAPPASIRIAVLDPSGAVIVGASVTLAPVGDASATRQAQTDERGEALFDAVAVGRYRVQAEAAGFDAAIIPELRARNGDMRKTVTLAIARVRESLTVEDVDRLRRAFVTVLTPAQIEALPDDPDEMEQVLRDMAGPGTVTIRVDGFVGVSLPRKSEIQSIRFRRDEFAAEHHARGSILVDIITKAGSGPLGGSIGSILRSNALGARNAFVPDRRDGGRQQYEVQFSGPLRRDRTSLSAKISRSAASTATPIVAALMTGPFNAQARQPIDQVTAAFRLKQALPASHLLSASVEQGWITRDELGVGGFSLPDRAYSSIARSGTVGIAESGPIGRHVFSELRVQQRAADTAFSPASLRPAIVVLDAFQTGGAQIAGSRATRTLELEENVDVFTGGAHAMRAGVLLERATVRSDVAQNAGGTFTFAGLSDFAAGRPATFTRRLGDPRVDFTQYRLGWYVQDDVRVRSSLLLSAGLRQESESRVGGWLNASPRVAVTWAAAGRTAIYAGGGVFHEWLDADTFETTIQTDGERQWDEVILAPGYPDPLAAGSARALPRSRIALAPALDLPTIARASARIQQRLAGHALLTARYAEERGIGLFRGRNINAPFAGGSRPDPRFGNEIEIDSSGRSSLRSLALGLMASVPRRGSATVNYEIASAHDDADDALSLPADSHRPAAEWGPARTDVRHRVNAFLSTAIWHGVKLDTRIVASSAAPYTITTGRDDNGDSVVNDRPAGVGRNSARGSWQRAVSTRVTWRRGFGPPAPGVSGFSSAGSGDMTLGAGPSGTLRRLTIVLYADAQNVFNQVNYTSYSGVMTSPFFGRPTAAATARQVQIGAQFVF